MITLERNGQTKIVSTGYSWKSLLFGVFYAAYRGDLKGFIIQFTLGFITAGFSWVIVPVFYNRIYLGRMINKGWGIK